MPLYFFYHNPGFPVNTILHKNHKNLWFIRFLRTCQGCLPELATLNRLLSIAQMNSPAASSGVSYPFLLFRGKPRGMYPKGFNVSHERPQNRLLVRWWTFQPVGSEEEKAYREILGKAVPGDYLTEPARGRTHEILPPLSWSTHERALCHDGRYGSPVPSRQDRAFCEDDLQLPGKRAYRPVSLKKGRICLLHGETVRLYKDSVNPRERTSSSLSNTTKRRET